ncbi:MAG: ATP-binding protein [Gammaproteobacteria bacterium]|nr:ATP-binding protein [Gammaproteobacteria bacterium]
MINRILHDELINALSNMPAVALLGPRQVGKTTLALELSKSSLNKPVHYLDLELDTDIAKLEDAEGFLRTFADKLLIIDEVQLKPDLFKVLRGLIDIRKRAGENNAQYLLLGSASRDLLRQSSESLAGRIRYLELKPFSVMEVEALDPLEFSPEKLWFRGGFPQSYLAPSNEESWNWRSDFIASYIERDIPQLGANISATKMRRFWTMVSHFQGQQVNMSTLGKSLEASHTTIKNYLDILTGLYMLRQLQPWAGNTKKRLVKSPKIYIRDTGLLHRLLSISDFDDLLGHPVLGHSWEGFVIENILGNLSDKWRASYYRTSDQTEIDLVLEKSTKEVWAIEIKRTSSPKTKTSFHNACREVKATRKFIIYGGTENFPLANDTEAIGLIGFVKLINEPDH